MQEVSILAPNLTTVKMPGRKVSPKPLRAAGKARSSYHHRDLRSALLTTALDAVEREGMDFTLRQLARRIGVSHAAPYAHYADKAELLADVARIGFERLAEALSASTTTASDARSRLLDSGRAYVRFALANPALYRLMFGRERTAAAPAPALAAAAQAAFAILVTVLRELPFRGAPRALERVRGDAVSAWAQVHGLSLLMIDGHLETSARESGDLIDTAVRAVAEGIAPDDR
jgi:AcrR family transcriptional regulator